MDDTSTVATTRTSTRLATASLLVLLAPVLAWMVWVLPVGEAASDARHVLWFVTVAVACLVAGVVSPPRFDMFAVLWILSVVSATTVLFLWWSSTDLTGLFMVGVVLAALAMSIAAPLLLLTGGTVGHAVRR